MGSGGRDEGAIDLILDLRSSADVNFDILDLRLSIEVLNLDLLPDVLFSVSVPIVSSVFLSIVTSLSFAVFCFSFPFSLNPSYPSSHRIGKKQSQT